jgi:hypothetical protein
MLDAFPFVPNRVWIALAISIAVHLLALVYLTVSPPLRDRPPTRLLVKFVLPAPIAAPTTPVEPAPAEPFVAVPEPANARAALSPVRRSREETTALFAAPRDAEIARHGPLNLSLPAAVSDSEPHPVATDGPFDPDIAKAVAKRQETRTRVALAARRRAQREGVSSKDYERDVAAGHTIKTDSGCFDLRNDQTIDPNDQVWWRTPCRQAHASAWEQGEMPEAELHPSLRH